MKKRLQVLMLAALPIFGALALYALKQYQLPENVFRRNVGTQGVTMVRIATFPLTGYGDDADNHGLCLNASDSALFVANFHLENHSSSDAILRGTSPLSFFRGDRQIGYFSYRSSYVLSNWWQGRYALTPSSKRELDAILEKYGRRLR